MQTIRLSTTPGAVNPGAYLSQYDVGRQILIMLYDDAGKYIPAAGSSVHIRATKPSGFGFDVACIWSQNTVTVTVTEDMSNESGSFPAELRIEKDGGILGTANFLWNVERSTHLNGTVDGNTEAKGLMSALMSAIEDAENAAAAALQAGLSDDIKQALLNCFAHVAWIDDQGQTYYDALYEALYPPVPATAITLSKSSLGLHELNAEYTLIATLTPEDTTDTVVWSSSDTSIATVDSNGKVKAIAYGSATITATAGSVSATCAVTVAQVTLSSIDATFTQGSATIYTNDSLDDLKQYLVVKAIYSDSSEETLSDTDYTLSGTLTAGTSTITATYEGKTDTFTVTVTQYVPHYAIVNNLMHVASSNAGVTSVEENDSYATSLGVQQGYTMQSVTVTMGGTDITSTVYNSGTGQISIAAVTGNVVITAAAVLTPSSITAVFTQGSATIYDTDSLDTLKQYLVVSATYPDSSSETIPSTDYTLSGTLTTGTSTITVTYAGKTDTFNVTVTHYVIQYTVTNTLTHVANSNSATQASGQSSYAGTLTAESGYVISNVTVTMGGTDITATAYDSSTGAISIASVTGNIEITAIGVEDVGWISGQAYSIEWIEGYNIGSAGDAFEQPNYKITDYLPCHGVTAIKCDMSENVVNRAYYDENKNVIGSNISKFYSDVGEKHIIPNDGAYYVRIAIYKTASGTVTPYLYPDIGESTVWEDGKIYNLPLETGSTRNTVKALCFGAATANILVDAAIYGYRGYYSLFDSAKQRTNSMANTNNFTRSAISIGSGDYYLSLSYTADGNKQLIKLSAPST